MFYNHKSKLMIAVLLLANIQVNCMATVGKRVLQAYGVGIAGSGVYNSVDTTQNSLADLKSVRQVRGESLYDKQHIGETITYTTLSILSGFIKGIFIGAAAPVAIPVTAAMYCRRMLEARRKPVQVDLVESKPDESKAACNNHVEYDLGDFSEDKYDEYKDENGGVWYEKRKYFVSIDEHGVETWTRNKPVDQEWI